MKDEELQILILESLTEFYQRRTRLLETLKFRDALRQENPYLLRVNMGHGGPKIVEHILSAHLSLSDERFFGEAFLKIARVVSKGFVSPNQFGYGHLFNQAFWQEITGDPDFYLKIIRLMDNDTVRQCRYEFDNAWANANNRCVGEFLSEFCNKDGSINWELLVKLNSGSEKPRKQKRKTA